MPAPASTPQIPRGSSLTSSQQPAYAVPKNMPKAHLSISFVSFLTLFLALVGGSSVVGDPLVVSTWPFKEAVRAAWKAVDAGLSAVDSVVEGCSACEVLRCDGTVGPGGSPDENGETTIDAMIMNGVTMEVGAVGAMRYVKDGIRAAKLVMDYSQHTFLVGEKASAFAISMGLQGPMNLSSSESIEKWNAWRDNECQPNFRQNVLPANGCGPYHNDMDTEEQVLQCSGPSSTEVEPRSSLVGHHNHDTISMAVIDRVRSRETSPQFNWMRSYQVVESMRRGMEPKLAAEDAISRIAKKFPGFVGALFAVNKNGSHAGACHGWTFQYSVRNSQMNDVQVFTVLPAG
ncbi:Probable isoaspartyl peptidase/L-asparaginase 3 [Linum grandiflorum]